ncbi:hypothetical protein KIL84_007492 [Mauremys mutica]|uniref:Uncharacterized protein n=1 Tax=Mauremys mutica TaxID=74926 RepID=A0A9D3X152_9SAUR|nr:hypothetical protein KIL84_007492 [Mauremys mutica]
MHTSCICNLASLVNYLHRRYPPVMRTQLPIHKKVNVYHHRWCMLLVNQLWQCIPSKLLRGEHETGPSETDVCANMHVHLVLLLTCTQRYTTHKYEKTHTQRRAIFTHKKTWLFSMGEREAIKLQFLVLMKFFFKNTSSFYNTTLQSAHLLGIKLASLIQPSQSAADYIYIYIFK